MVVSDTVKVDGTLEEATLDWYAQDKQGNVWYFGEESKEYANGQVVSTKGSWEAGVNGAQPGITGLEPSVVEDKYYASGIGLVLVTLEGGTERLELIEIVK